MSIADGDDEGRLVTENSQFGQAPSSPNPEHHVLQLARRDLGAIHRAAQMAHRKWITSSTTTKISLQYPTHDSWRRGLSGGWDLQCPAVPAGTIRKFCSRTSTGNLWTSWSCSWSCYESYSSGNDLQIQRHWEQCWGEFQSSTARNIVRNHFRLSSCTRSQATLSVSRSYSRDDAERLAIWR